MTNNVWNITNIDKVCEIRANTPSFLYLRHFQAIDTSFLTITKLSSNGIRETFCEELKWMCELFETNVQQDF